MHARLGVMEWPGGKGRRGEEGGAVVMDMGQAWRRWAAAYARLGIVILSSVPSKLARVERRWASVPKVTRRSKWPPLLSSHLSATITSWRWCVVARVMPSIVKPGSLVLSA